MNKLYQDLEFDVILSNISTYCSFDLGVQRILELKAHKTRLAAKRELALTAEAMAMVELAQEYDLDGVVNFSAAIERAKKDLIIYGNDFLAIKNHNIAMRKIRNAVFKSEMNLQTLEDLVNTLTLVDELQEDIDKKINNYGDLHDHASVRLKTLKEESKEIQATFNRHIRNYLNSHKNEVIESIASERNGRMVVLIANSYKNKLDGIVHGESQSGQSIYFEPASFVAFNNSRQSVANLIQEESDKILFDLSQKVKHEADILMGNLKTLSYLDATLAKAYWGFEHQAIVADLSDDKSIFLKNVAHPLIEKERVVANTYNMIDNSVLIISGPNTGGKTVSLKTIGLSVLMTLSGIPVIAEEAHIPIVDQIFVDLGDQQSVVESLSTFSSHLSKLAHITNHVTNNSLVLLDELGGGTDPKEGEALALAIMDYLRQREAIIVVTTHLAELKKYAQIHDDVILASVEFDEESLKPTYRFIEGLAGQSNALDIARRYGIKEEIIANAHDHKNQLISHEEALMGQLEQQERLLMQKEESLKQLQEDLIQKEEELDNELMKLDRSSEKLMMEAEIKAQTLVEDTERKMDVLFNEMKELHGFSKMHEAIAIKSQVKSPKRKSKTEKSQHNFQVGDRVRVDSMSQIATIKSIQGNNVTVDLNGLSVNTKKERLTFEGSNDKKVKKPAKKSVSVKAQKIKSSELNLIGKRVAEALIELDRYIDRAVASNYPQVTIIHGMGTGKLRSAVQNALKKNKHVASFKMAPANQGGAGATQVTLK